MAFDDVTIIEINAGLHGFWNVPNSNRVPLGGLISLRNATIEGRSWRALAGTLNLAGATGGAPYVRAVLDYWPQPDLQRTLFFSQSAQDNTGRINKHDIGDAGTPLVLRRALPVGGVAMFAVIGAESFNRPRKAIFTNGLGPPQVLAGDGIATTDLATPNPDWGGSSWPRFFVPHQGYAWAGGNESASYTLYRSSATDHEDFSVANGFRIACGPLDQQQRLVGAISYKGGLLVFASPVGVYFIDTTTSVTATDWVAKLVAYPGAANARCIAMVEDNVMWASPSGTIHALSATQATGSVRASDLTYRKLGTWAAETIAPGHYEQTASLIYDSERSTVMLVYPLPTTDFFNDGSLPSGILQLHLPLQAELSEQWSVVDSLYAEAIYVRRHGGRPRVVILNNSKLTLFNAEYGGDAVDVASPFEWWMQDTDLSAVLPRAAGRYKNLHFVQIEYVPRGGATHTVELWADGSKKQTITMSLTATGTVLPATLPWTLSPLMLKLTPERKLNGRARRFALRGYTTDGEDVEITKVIVGVSLA